MRFLFFLLPLALALTGCDALFGSKDDATTDEVFDEGAVDPTLLDEVGYVPLNPFYTQAANGGALDAPVDVYVGYDELIYVADRQGLHVLDLAGRPQTFVGDLDGQPLRDVAAVVQDRSLDLLVAARRDTTLASEDGSRTWDLPVVYRISGLTTGAPVVEDVIWHPFDDRSRLISFSQPQEYLGGCYSDEDARFTDVAVLADNSFYVARSGLVNTQAEGKPDRVRPFNGVLAFDPDGTNTRYVSALSATQPSLLSAVYPSALATPIGPPQRSTFTEAEDFFVAQRPPSPDSLMLMDREARCALAPVPPIRYPVLSVLVVETSLGTEFQVDIERLGASANPDNGDGFLYEDFGMRGPTSLAIAADETGYLFVTDEETDSLYVFNRNGVEGVAPPPASTSIRPVKVSFGGTGGGALSFRDPQGVAYFERIVYVADAGNDRIARYRLNTDFE